MLMKSNSLDKLFFPLLPLFSDEGIKSHCHSFCWKCLPSQPVISLWPQDFSPSWGIGYFCKGLMLTLWWTSLFGEACPPSRPLLLVWVPRYLSGHPVSPLSLHMCFGSSNGSVLWFWPISCAFLSHCDGFGDENKIQMTEKRAIAGSPGKEMWSWRGAILDLLPQLALCATDIEEGK